MGLSNDLVSQFVKITKDDKKTSSETTVNGTVVFKGRVYVRLDGAPEEVLTPISTTTNVQDGQRVTVMIKDHTATITGNVSSPSVGSEDVNGIFTYEITSEDGTTTSVAIDKLLEIIRKYAGLGELEETVISLKDDLETGKKLTQAELDAIADKIDGVESTIDGFSEEFTTEDLEALNAEITNLKGYTAEFTYLSAINANIKNLDVKYANIDFANIGELAVRKIFAESGIIKELATDNQYITGELVGVTISGDLIKANTLVADKLVVRGDDGKYYNISTDFNSLVSYVKTDMLAEDGLPEGVELEGVLTTTGEQVYSATIEGADTDITHYFVEGEIDEETGAPIRYVVERIGIKPVESDAINGSTIVARSITADKMSVGELAAFEATIGGFSIVAPDSTNDIPGAIYSGTKATIDASVAGLYLGYDGQFSMGGANNFIRFRRIYDEDGTPSLDENGDAIYKLEISADSILFGDKSKSSLDDVKKLTEHVKIGTCTDPETDEVNPSVELSEGDSSFKQVITNKASRIMDGDNVVTEMNTEGVETENVMVRGEVRHGEWAWVRHGKGNLGLIWKTGVTE